MSALSEYLHNTTDPNKQEFLREQYHEASNHGSIHCCCGQIRALTMAYRCLYCGLWFCRSCSEVHFGMTIQEWRDKKKIAGGDKSTLVVDLATQKCKHFTQDEKPANNRPA